MLAHCLDESSMSHHSFLTLPEQAGLSYYE